MTEESKIVSPRRINFASWCFGAGIVALQFVNASLALAGGVSGGGLTGSLGGGGGANLPWDDSVGTLQSSMTGAVAPAAIIIAVVLAGIVMAMRGDLDGMGPRLTAIFIAGAAAVGAVAVVGTFGGAGALVQ